MNGRPDDGRSRQIAADIDRTRKALDRTVDAIVGKLTPSQLLWELAHILRSGSGSVVSRVVTTAREHPVPATIVAAGLGMILWERSGRSPSSRDFRSGFAGYEPEYGGGVYEGDDGEPGGIRRVKEKAREAASGVGEKLEEVKDTVQQKTEQVREGAQHVKETVGEEARRLKETARRQIKEAKIGFWQTMDQQPLMVGGIALALGAAVALMVPRTSREDELLGETKERVKEKAEELGRQALDRGKEVAHSAAEVLREEARAQGIAPDQLAEKVRTVARDTGQAIREKAEETLEPVGAGTQRGPGSNQG